MGLFSWFKRKKAEVPTVTPLMTHDEYIHHPTPDTKYLKPSPEQKVLLGTVGPKEKAITENRPVVTASQIPSNDTRGRVTSEEDEEDNSGTNLALGLLTIELASELMSHSDQPTQNDFNGFGGGSGGGGGAEGSYTPDNASTPDITPNTPDPTPDNSNDSTSNDSNSYDSGSSSYDSGSSGSSDY